MEYIILFGTLLVLLAIGVPVAFCLLSATLATVLYLALPPIVVFQQMGSDITSVALLAIPLFIFTGELMMKGGLSDRMIALASSMVGHVRGGLGQVTVTGSTLFGGVSGSAIADVSAIGGTMIPQMQKRGYDSDYAVNVTISAALVALLVPPSHNMILYSASAGGGVSISDLFAAGILPAGLLAVTLMITAYVVARKRGYAADAFPGFRAVAVRLVAAIPGLLLVGIIFGGIRAGIFTPTEAALVATVYALLVGGLIYRTLTVRGLYESLADAAASSAVVMLVVAYASLFGWVVTVEDLVGSYSGALLGLSDNGAVILIVIMLILLIAGMFMDAVTVMFISLPIFMPVVHQLGWDPVWFGVLLMVNLAIGLITPPVGINLYVAANVTKLSIEKVARGALPFLLASLVGLFVVAVFPDMSLYLVRLMGK